jgi:hypothetical protein
LNVPPVYAAYLAAVNGAFCFGMSLAGVQQIDLRVESVQQYTWPGIYKLDGDTVAICHAGEAVRGRGSVDTARPADFKAGPTAFLIVCKCAEKR